MIKVRISKQSSQGGQAIVIIALAMIAMMAFLVLGVDGSRYFSQRRVSQNASDMAALAGVYKLSTNPSITDKATLIQINTIAEHNGIPDTDGTAGNEINANVTAWWTDGTDAGSTHAAQQITTGTTAAPSWAKAVKVQTNIPYQTFVGGFVGQKNLTAQSSGTAKISPIPVSYDDLYKDTSGFMGGRTCADSSSQAYGTSTDSSKQYFTGDLIVGGFLAANSRGSKFLVTGNMYTTFQTQAELEALSFKFNPDSNSNVTGNLYDKNSTQAQALLSSSKSFPTWAYYPVNGVDMQIQASFFKPEGITGAPANGTVSGNYIYDDYVTAGSPGNLFHYIADTGNETTNGTNLGTSVAANGAGIYYVDGNVLIGDYPRTDITIIANGRVVTQGNNSTIATVPSAWGFGISVLAGGGTPNPPAPQGCDNSSNTCSASGGYSSEAQFVTDANGQYWTGVLYVPNGLAEIDGNVNMNIEAGPVVAYSMSQGDCHPANNWHFGKCQVGAYCWVHPPLYGTALQH